MRSKKHRGKGVFPTYAQFLWTIVFAVPIWAAFHYGNWVCVFWTAISAIVGAEYGMFYTLAATAEAWAIHDKATSEAWAIHNKAVAEASAVYSKATAEAFVAEWEEAQKCN